MAEITVILGSIGLFVAGFVAWYTLWHRRVATSFERVRVGSARSARCRAPGRRRGTATPTSGRIGGHTGVAITPRPRQVP